jgi:hypothetical protein
MANTPKLLETAQVITKGWSLDPVLLFKDPEASTTLLQELLQHTFAESSKTALVMKNFKMEHVWE